MDSDDLELHVDGKVLKGHIAWLSKHSKVFADIISDLQQTAKASEGQILVRPMVGDDHPSILCLLQFIYETCSSFDSRLDTAQPRKLPSPIQPTGN